MSLNITKETTDRTTFFLEGRLDTLSAPKFAQELEQCEENMTDLVLDFEKLVYISSAGLRDLLKAQKMMNKKGGTLKVLHVQEAVMEILEITGFADLLTIE